MFKCMGCMKEYEEEYEVCPHCGYIRGTQANEVFHLQPENILQGRYIIGRVIGFGGFGVTYLAWDGLFEKEVAIKEYFPSEFATRMPGETTVSTYEGERREQFEEGRDKFEDEAKRLVKFQGTKGIVEVYDVFHENDTAYIVMEYLEGENLKTYLDKRGKLDVEEASYIITQVLEALCVIHKAGMLHRDIAPDNIFITSDNEIKLLDFGAARFATTKHSKSLSVLLKPGYSPEEQYRSRGDQGTWTDVYATAATFYKLITGITPVEAMDRIAKDTLKEPSKLGVKISKSMENSIMNAMNIAIEGRTQTAEAFLEDLRAEEVKRIRIKKRKMDIGRWPLWTKISASVACCAIVGFLVLLTTGVIKFDIISTSRSSLPEGYTRVPNVINMSCDDAEVVCEANKIILQVYGKEYSENIDAGMILGQQLYGGSIVNENATLMVLASAGAMQVQVPNVVGMLEAEAGAILDDTDLVYGCDYMQDCTKPGAVISQSLEPMTFVDAGTAMEIIISTGKSYNVEMDTTVPDLTNLTYDEAKQAIDNSALYIYKIKSEHSNEVPKDVILSQNIAPGTTVKQGEVIEVIVSLGREQIAVPDVQYSTVEQARETLETLGFVVSVTYVENDYIAKDLVVSQSLEMNTMADKGSTIVLNVSSGNENANLEENVPVDLFITQEMQEVYNAEQGVVAEDGTVEYEAVNRVKLVAVPSVKGMSEEQARKSLEGLGLTCSVSYSHSESNPDGCVMGQNISAGTEIAKGTSINISVCNNTMRTEYRTRSVAEETVTSSSDTLDGWELYDTTQSWSDYGTKQTSLTAVAASDSVKVETVTEYRYRTKETKTSSNSSESGWTYVKKEVTGYTAWGSEQSTTTKPTESDTLDIVSTSSTTTYLYHHFVNQYTNGSYGIDSVSSGSGNGDTIKKSLGEHTYSTTSPLSKVSFSDIGGKQGYGSHTCTQGTCATNDPFNYWFLKNTTTTTTYKYKTRSPIYTYYFERWTDWTSWSATNAAPAGATVENRTVYNYWERSKITTYHFKRNVYGEWSEWSTTPATESEALDVETREVYVY